MENPIKAIIFDRDGIVVKAKRLVIENVPSYILSIRAAIVSTDFISVLDQTHARESTSGAWSRLSASLRPLPYVDDFAHQCKQAGLRVSLLANIDWETTKELFADSMQASPDSPKLSCFVGNAMPDPEIYIIVESLLEVLPREIAFLSSNDEHIEGAQQRNWQTIKVTSVKQAIRDASELLDL